MYLSSQEIKIIVIMTLRSRKNWYIEGKKIFVHAVTKSQSQLCLKHLKTNSELVQQMIEA